MIAELEERASSPMLDVETEPAYWCLGHETNLLSMLDCTLQSKLFFLLLPQEVTVMVNGCGFQSKIFAGGGCG